MGRDAEVNAGKPAQASSTVGVVPAIELRRRPALFGALRAAFPVRFEARDRLDDLAGLDGQLVFGRQGPSEPVKSARTADECPRLVVAAHASRASTHGAQVEFADDADIARPLRGRRLTELLLSTAASARPCGRDRVLAVSGATALWWACAGAAWSQSSACTLDELRDGETLRERLSVGRFMALVPLIHFLRRVTAVLACEQQPLRASFVIDDPNLHWPSYGYLDYAEMVAHADEHGYHVGLAMVPLDGWLCNRRAASLIERNPAAVSLLMHGNDHLARELGALQNDRRAEAVLAQALRRTRAFERRSGLEVQRVMVPPHEACSAKALKAMARLGFDAACIGRPRPWGEHDPPPPSRSLMRWGPADMVDGVLPVLPRYLIDRPREELVLRALLGQPLILFGHHWDFADGLELLAEAAGFIDGLGDVRWDSVAQIARRGYHRRRDGESLHVQTHARRVTVEVPEGVQAVHVVAAEGWGTGPAQLLARQGGCANVLQPDRDGVFAALEVVPGSCLELELLPLRVVDPAAVPPARAAAWPIGRRALVELRDRMRPLTGRKFAA